MEPPKPVRFFSSFYISLNILLISWLTFLSYKKMFFSASYVVFTIIICSFIYYSGYVKRKKINENIKDLHSINFIISNVVFKKEENSIIFNFVFPSERILGVMKKIVKEFNDEPK